MTHKWRMRDAFLRHLCTELHVRPAPPRIRGWRGCGFARISAGFGFDRFLAVDRRLLGQRRGDGGRHLAAGRYRGDFARFGAGFGFDRHLVRLVKETPLGATAGAVACCSAWSALRVRSARQSSASAPPR
jgi:hypothetical protein